VDVLVFGHKNPDTDSIAAAIAYAWLANETEDQPHVPARLGEPNAETRWVSDRFGIEVPPAIGHVRMTARDAMKSDVVMASPDAPMHEVGRLMAEHDVRAVPIVRDGRVEGIVSTRELAFRYLEESEITGFAQAPTTVGALAASIGATVLQGEPEAPVAGEVRIGAMEPETMARYVEPGDVVIIGDRVRGQQVAVDGGAACLVITGGFAPSEELMATARTAGTALLSSKEGTYAVARRINLAVHAQAVMERHPLVVSPEDLLPDVLHDLVGSPHREALVCDEGGALIGLISRTDLARAARRSVVLVDHSEESQSAEGLSEARILAVIDHHRLGDVESAEPITYVAKPVGATSTIIAEMAKGAGLEPSASLAGLMLAAILSDTVILRSPTTTELDRRMAAWLAELAGEEAESLGLAMYRGRQEGEAFDADKAVRGDLKLFNFRGQRVAIAQLETVDSDTVMARRAEIIAALERLVSDRELDVAVLMVTDVLKQGSVLLSHGRRRAVLRAFQIEDDPERFLPGVLSRKKQVAAVLARALG
jgi:manganese-dependent inorganic pyrophosphatase